MKNSILIICIVSILTINLSGETAQSAHERLRHVYAIETAGELTDVARVAMDNQRTQYINRATAERNSAVNLEGEEREAALRRAELYEERSNELTAKINASVGDVDANNAIDREIRDLNRSFAAGVVPELHPNMNELEFKNYLRGLGYTADTEQVVEEMLRRRNFGRFGGASFLITKRSSANAAHLLNRTRAVMNDDRRLGRRMGTDYDDSRNKHLAIFNPIIASSPTLGTYQRMDAFGRLYHITEVEEYLRNGTIPPRYRTAWGFNNQIRPDTYVSDAGAIILWRRTILDVDLHRRLIEDTERLKNQSYDQGAKAMLRNRASAHLNESLEGNDGARINHRAQQTDRISERVAQRLAENRSRELVGGSDGRETANRIREGGLSSDTNVAASSDLRREIEDRNLSGTYVNRALSDRTVRDGESHEQRYMGSSLGFGQSGNITIQDSKVDAERDSAREARRLREEREAREREAN